MPLAPVELLDLLTQRLRLGCSSQPDPPQLLPRLRMLKELPPRLLYMEGPVLCSHTPDALALLGPALSPSASPLAPVVLAGLLPSSLAALPAAAAAAAAGGPTDFLPAAGVVTGRSSKSAVTCRLLLGRDPSMPRARLASRLTAPPGTPPESDLGGLVPLLLEVSCCWGKAAAWLELLFLMKLPRLDLMPAAPSTSASSPPPAAAAADAAAAAAAEAAAAAAAREPLALGTFSRPPLIPTAAACLMGGELGGGEDPGLLPPPTPAAAESAVHELLLLLLGGGTDLALA
jgi:hypothetical protein